MSQKDTINNEFLQAYDKYASNILKHVYFRTGSMETAEDLTQETFLKTWNYIAQGPNKIKSYKTFIFRVANNLIIDHYRQKPKTPVSIENFSTNSFSIEPEQEKKVQNVLNKNVLKKHLLELCDDYRRIIIYRYIDDLSIEEISKITKRSPNNISVIIHRALKILKNKMNYLTNGYAKETSTY